MKEAKECLKEFLMGNANVNERNEEFVINIKRFNVSRILLDELKYLDSREYKDACERILGQKDYNDILLYEITQFLMAFNEENITILFLKGYFLATDLYDLAEIRKSNDIDLLVDYSDLQRALEIFHNLGYIYKNGDDILDKPIREIYDINNYTHICPMMKKNIYNGQEKIIYIDLHINPLHNMPMYDKSNPLSVIYRSHYEAIDGYEVCLLELHDRLVHLIGHFVDHLIGDIHRQLDRKGKHFSVRLSHLHDIALFIDKYNNDINWSTIIERSQIMEQRECISLAIYLLNRIYPERIPENVLSSLLNLYNDESVDKTDLRYKTISTMIESNPDELLLHDSYEYLDEFICKLRRRYSHKLECDFYMDGVEKESEYFALNGYYFRKNNKKIKVDDLTELQKYYINIYKSKGNISWNFDHFRLELLITCESEKDDNSSIIEKINSIKIAFDTGRSPNYLPFIHRLTFNYVNWKETSVAKLLSNNEDSIVLSNNMFEVCSNKSSFKISLNIPWEFIGITPYVARKIGFQTAVVLKNDEDNNILCLRWGNDNFSDMHPISQESGEIFLA